MFARTTRLLLRPAWPEDAAAIAQMLGEAAAVRSLSPSPWLYGLAQAPRDPVLPTLLIFERTAAAPRLVGVCRLTRRTSGAADFAMWIAQADRGQGFATEAGAALIEIARTLQLAGLVAACPADDRGSARLLDKLGFCATGLSAEPPGGAGAALSRLDFATRTALLAA